MSHPSVPPQQRSHTTQYIPASYGHADSPSLSSSCLCLVSLASFVDVLGSTLYLHCLRRAQLRYPGVLQQRYTLPGISFSPTGDNGAHEPCFERLHILPCLILCQISSWIRPEISFLSLKQALCTAVMLVMTVLLNVNRFACISARAPLANYLFRRASAPWKGGGFPRKG